MESVCGQGERKARRETQAAPPSWGLYLSRSLDTNVGPNSMRVMLYCRNRGLNTMAFGVESLDNV